MNFDRSDLWSVAVVGPWLFCVVNGLLMLRHREPGKSVSWFLPRGYAFWTMTGFTEAAEPAHRRMIVGAILFGFGCLLRMAGLNQ